MRRPALGLLAGTAAAGLAATALQTPATAVVPAGAPDARDSRAALERTFHPDALPNPLADKQNALRDRAIAQLMRGTADLQRRSGGDVVRLGRGAYVEVRRRAAASDPDQILTFLSEFGDRHKAGTPQGRPGPLHNQIPKPDRFWNGNATDDNSTIWQPKYTRAHYLDMLFGPRNSMRHFYKKQSSGEYAIAGDVSNWVKVPYRESRYGYNEGGSIVAAEGVWNYVKDTARAWYRSKINAGWSNAQVQAYLSRFDQWDRYDHDGDGDFDESDGYIDHFQAVHAGEGEETGAPPWTIWSHRWYAFQNLIGSAGPAGAPFGGVQIGKSGFWIGDYTTEPENGGLGVFAHEYGHDLGLADYYDTAGGDNSTGFWTIMSAGSYLNRSKTEIGTRPGYMGPHEKLLLGWLEFDVVDHQPGTTSKVKLGPAELQRGPLQALAVVLPRFVKTIVLGDPPQGDKAYWSTMHDSSTTTMSRNVALRAGAPARLTFQTWYDIEDCQCDYAYVEVKDGAKPWTPIAGNITRPDENNGITGTSDGWKNAVFDLSDYAGKTVGLRFRYTTDPAIQQLGFMADVVKVTSGGSTVFSDGAESGSAGWKLDGFKITDGTEKSRHFQYYLVENRRYIGYDDTLRVGPYNFGWAYSRPNWVERFPYQDGMLVWYANEAFDDNNTSQHPGYGMALPVDSYPRPIVFDDGSLLGNRRQPFDATFGLDMTDRVLFHRERVKKNGDIVVMTAGRQVRPQKSLFNDSRVNRYWTAANPWGSAKVAGSGTRIKVLDERLHGRRIVLRVSFE